MVPLSITAGRTPLPLSVEPASTVSEPSAAAPAKPTSTLDVLSTPTVPPFNTSVPTWTMPPEFAATLETEFASAGARVSVFVAVSVPLTSSVPLVTAALMAAMVPLGAMVRLAGWLPP